MIYQQKNYTHGKLDGVTETWSESGLLTVRSTYRYGSLITSESYDSNGVLSGVSNYVHM